MGKQAKKGDINLIVLHAEGEDCKRMLRKEKKREKL